MRLTLLGLVAGVVWAAALRAWMRMVSDYPEFTWSGTGFILAIGAVVGVALGAAEVGRRRRARAWRLRAVPALSVGLGAGAPLVPTALLGGLVVSRRGPAAVRLLAGLGALLPLWLIWTALPYGHSPVRKVADLLVYAVLVGLLAVATSVIFRPSAAGIGGLAGGDGFGGRARVDDALLQERVDGGRAGGLRQQPALHQDP